MSTALNLKREIIKWTLFGKNEKKVLRRIKRYIGESFKIQKLES